MNNNYSIIVNGITESQPLSLKQYRLNKNKQTII